MAELEPEWQIVNKNTPYINDSDWMKEEERLLDFAEKPAFEKQPLDHIALTFLYVDSDRNIIGVAKSTIHLNVGEQYSRLNETVFFNKVNVAKKPKHIFSKNIEIEFARTPELDTSVGVRGLPKGEVTREDLSSKDNADWLEKAYTFECATLYSVPIGHENINIYEPSRELSPLYFHKNTAKILGSLIIFHDLYEIVILMREEKTELKSIMKTGCLRSSSTFTKKVRFPPVLTNERTTRGKRKTKRVR